MPDWFADLSLVLLTYAVIALLTAWVMAAIIRDGYVDDHPTCGRHHSPSEE